MYPKLLASCYFTAALAAFLPLNVIIGKLIPAGSGLSLYRNVKSEMDEEAGSEPEDYVDLSVLVNRSNAL